MEFTVFSLLFIVGLMVYLAFTKPKANIKSRQDADTYPYRLTKYLLSRAERSFYGVLVQAVGESGIVFSKVRVADVLTPKKVANRADWQRAFNTISSKHFDFIVCDPSDCSIKLAIELDDSSHASSKVRQRDDLVNNACASAGLPILRVKAAQSYAVAELRRQVNEMAALQSSAPEIIAAPAIKEPFKRSEPSAPSKTFELSESGLASFIHAKSDTGQKHEAKSVTVDRAKPKGKVCPKCGDSMVLRTVKSGANAGQEFWGCGAFPKCRTMLPKAS